VGATPGNIDFCLYLYREQVFRKEEGWWSYRRGPEKTF
jgi:hypothetical protein